MPVGANSQCHVIANSADTDATGGDVNRGHAAEMVNNIILYKRYCNVQFLYIIINL